MLENNDFKDINFFYTSYNVAFPTASIAATCSIINYRVIIENSTNVVTFENTLTPSKTELEPIQGEYEWSIQYDTRNGWYLDYSISLLFAISFIY